AAHLRPRLRAHQRPGGLRRHGRRNRGQRGGGAASPRRRLNHLAKMAIRPNEPASRAFCALKPTANTCRKLSSAHWVHIGRTSGAHRVHIGGKRFTLRTKEVVVMRVHSRLSFWTVVVMLVLTVSMVASAQTRIPIGVLVPFT